MSAGLSFCGGYSLLLVFERNEASKMIVFDHASKVYPNGTVGLKDVTTRCVR